MGILNAQHLAPAAGFFEPQRKYDWSLEIALDDAGDQVVIMQSLESCGGVKMSIEEIPLHYAAETRYVPGKVTFEEMELKLKDFVDIGSANALLKWFRQVYNPETGAVGLARNLKKNADLTLFAPDQTIVRIYKLIGLWPKKFEHGDFSMSENGMVLLTASLRYDRAIPGTGLNQSLSGINVGVLSPAL